MLQVKGLWPRLPAASEAAGFNGRAARPRDLPPAPVSPYAHDVRVLIDYRPALRERTGVGEYVHQLARALARHADGEPDELSIFTSSWKDRPRPDLAAELPGVTVIDRRVPVRVLNWAWHRLGWPKVELLAGRSFDLVHSPHPLLLPSAAAQVVTIHDLDFLLHPERTAAEVRRDYPQLVRKHARLADQVIVSSRYAADEVTRRLNVAVDRIAICPPGAPEWAGAPRPIPAAGYILFVGTLEPRKNVGALLDAYTALLAKNPNAPRLVLAGRATAHAAPWLQALSRPPLAGRAEHLGYVSPETRRSLYENARLLVLPSHIEGFGLPALEAMAMGRPVVASRAGALPEVVGDAGLLVDPSDTVALADAIDRVISDETMARRLADRGLERARRFTWEATARAVRQAYRAAVARRRRWRAA